MTTAPDQSSRRKPTALRLVPDGLSQRITDALADDPDSAYGLRELVERCGTINALATITQLPAATAPTLRLGHAGNIDYSDLVDTRLGRFLDDEYRAIVLELARIAREHPSMPLGRRTTAPRLVAALTWIALTGNGKVGRSARWQAADIWYWFGVGDCAPLARSIAQDLGMVADPTRSSARYPHNDVLLGNAALLHTDARKSIATQRDTSLSIIDDVEARRKAARPMTPAGGGKVRIAARPLDILTAFRCSSEGRDHVMMTFGDEASDPDEVIALTIPDARLLHQRLGEALDGSSRVGVSPLR